MFLDQSAFHKPYADMLAVDAHFLNVDWLLIPVDDNRKRHPSGEAQDYLVPARGHAVEQRVGAPRAMEKRKGPCDLAGRTSDHLGKVSVG